MEDKICPSAEKCPIFSGILKDRVMTTKSYKTRFCEAGVQGREACKRWQVKQAYGKVPDTLLPNSPKNLEQIATENNY